MGAETGEVGMGGGSNGRQPPARPNGRPPAVTQVENDDGDSWGHTNTSCMEEFSRRLSQSSPRRGSSPLVADNGTSSMRQLDAMGGMRQPEFLSMEEREQGKDSMGFACLSAFRKIQETGEIDEAKRELQKETNKARELGEFQYAMACCMIAEHFNRWGSTSVNYNKMIMEQGSEYASIAVDVLHTLDEEQVTHELETALFWKTLNMATLAGSGGFKTSAQDAMAAAEAASEELQELTSTRMALPPEGKGKCDFVEGIICFSKAKAMGSSNDTVNDYMALHMKALEFFESAYRIWESEYGDFHPDTVKPVTMLAFTHKKVENFQDAYFWASKEYEIRVDIFGEHAPRTKAAKKFLRECRRKCAHQSFSDDDASKEGSDGSFKLFCSDDDIANRYSANRVPPEMITWEIDPFDLDEDFMVNSIMQMFMSSGTSDAFQIPQDRLARLIVETRKGYRNSNSFHNWRHAWSVTECAYLITMTPSVMRCLGVTDRLAVLVSAMLHDIDHPGVNSDFLIKSADPLAIKHPHNNVLERHHWALCQELLKEGSPTDILCNVDQEERSQVMDRIYDGIMATDMANHKTIVHNLQEKAKAMEYRGSGAAYCPSDLEETRQLLRSVVHAADLSAQGMPAHVAYKFGRGIVEEFHLQFTREKTENLRESAFMRDLHKPLAQAKAQLGFLQYVAGPMWKAIAEIFPELSERYNNIKLRAKEINFDEVDQWMGLHKGLMTAQHGSLSSCSLRTNSNSPNASSRSPSTPTIGSKHAVRRATKSAEAEMPQDGHIPSLAAAQGELRSQSVEDFIQKHADKAVPTSIESTMTNGNSVRRRPSHDVEDTIHEEEDELQEVKELPPMKPEVVLRSNSA